MLYKYAGANFLVQRCMFFDYSLRSVNRPRIRLSDERRGAYLHTLRIRRRPCAQMTPPKLLCVFTSPGHLGKRPHRARCTPALDILHRASPPRFSSPRRSNPTCPTSLGHPTENKQASTPSGASYLLYGNEYRQGTSRAPMICSAHTDSDI